MTNSLLATDCRAAKYWGPDLLDTDGQLDVETATIDAFCDEASIGHIDILKLDVQGAEYAVLKGAERMLDRHSIGVVYLEIIVAPTYSGQKSLQDYLALFASRGYELFDCYNPVRWRGRLLQTDNIFVSQAILDEYEKRVP